MWRYPVGAGAAGRSDGVEGEVLDREGLMAGRSRPCVWFQLRLLEYVRHELSPADHAAVKAHLEDGACQRCLRHHRAEKALHRLGVQRHAQKH